MFPKKKRHYLLYPQEGLAGDLEPEYLASA